MALCITTGFVLPTRLEILPFPMKSTVQLPWQYQRLLPQPRCHHLKSTLPGLIIQFLRQGTRLNAKQRYLAIIPRSPWWVQMYKATAIRMDLLLTPDIITESELPTGRLIPPTQMKRLL